MLESQIIFLANKFINLDVSFCDPEVYSIYIPEKRPDNKHALALSFLWNWSIKCNEHDKFIERDEHNKKNKLELDILDILKKWDLVSEASELLHGIEEEPNERQKKLFHMIEEYITKSEKDIALMKRSYFTKFLREKNINYNLESNFFGDEWVDLLLLIRVEFYLKGKIISALCFTKFLREKNINYNLGSNFFGDKWVDLLLLIRVEFYLKGKIISALFSPDTINCAVETCGIIVDGDPIYRWRSVEELESHISNMLQ